jgi:ActR/RegA family two-component response regulator
LQQLSGMMHHEAVHALPTHDPQHLADPAGDWPTLDVLRLRYIHRAIAHTNNNKTRAAELLGIDRRTLNRILARERAKRRAAAAMAPTPAH